MRLIDADALKDGILENITPYLGLYKNGEPRSFVRDDEVLRYIDGFPTVEPKRGEWVEDKYTRKCSVCGSTYWRRGGDEWNYCPNCGAKMDGGEDETD